MQRILISLTSLMLGACAASIRDGSEPGAFPGLATAESESITVLRRIDVSPSDADELICRREARTGSRIIEKRCYYRSDLESPEHELAQDLARRDLESMRQRQMYREQAEQARRQAIMQEALSRSR